MYVCMYVCISKLDIYIYYVMEVEVESVYPQD